MEEQEKEGKMSSDQSWQHFHLEFDSLEANYTQKNKGITGDKSSTLKP